MVAYYYGADCRRQRSSCASDLLHDRLTPMFCPQGLFRRFVLTLLSVARQYQIDCRKPSFHIPHHSPPNIVHKSDCAPAFHQLSAYVPLHLRLTPQDTYRLLPVRNDPSTSPTYRQTMSPDSCC